MDVDAPIAGPEEVLVRSRRVGICHSDIVLLEGDYTIPVTYPVIPGHEWAGEVLEVGPGVTDFTPGDHVVGEVVVGQHGGHHFGFTIDGAASEDLQGARRVASPDPRVVVLDPGGARRTLQHRLQRDGRARWRLSRRCDRGLRCRTDRPALRPGGDGERRSGRRRRAERESSRASLALGASAALDPRAADIGDAVAETTNGRGFDGVIEASGSPAAMAQALQVAADGGRIAYVGINVGATAEARLGLIQQRSLSIRGAVGSAGLWPRVIRLLASGVVDPTPIVTASFPLGQAPRGARRGTRHREPHQGPHPA